MYPDPVGTIAAPRFRMTRLSPSRTSTVLRSFSFINRVICSSIPKSIGLLEATFVLSFFFAMQSLDMTPLERLIQRRQHLAAAVGDQDVVLDADAAFAGEVNAGLDGHDHPGAQLFFAAQLAHHRQLVNLAADAVTEPMAE